MKVHLDQSVDFADQVILRDSNVNRKNRLTGWKKWCYNIPCALNREECTHQFLPVGLSVETHAEFYRRLKYTKTEFGCNSVTASHLISSRKVTC